MSADLTGGVAYLSFFLTVALINAIVCLGLNLQWGQTGAVQRRHRRLRRRGSLCPPRC